MAQTFQSVPNPIPNQSSDFQRSASYTDSFVLPTSADNAIVFGFAGFSGGRLIVDGPCTINWYETHKPDVAVVRSYDRSGTAISTTVAAAGGVEIPPSLFGCAFVAPVISSGTVNGILVLKK